MDNKLDELCLQQCTHQEIKHCCAFVFTETWLHDNILDAVIQLAVRTSFQADRDAASSSKGPEYIAKCVDDVTVTMCSNEKPWMTAEV